MRGTTWTQRYWAAHKNEAQRERNRNARHAARLAREARIRRIVVRWERLGRPDVGLTVSALRQAL